MLIRAGFDISFQVAQPTPMLALLSVHPSRNSDLRAPGTIRGCPDVSMRDHLDRFGNICTRFTIPTGGIVLSTSFVIEDSGRHDRRAPDGLQQPIECLPDDVLIYLLSSRYCETDRLMQLAWSKFGHYTSARDRVDAVVEFVHRHITFGYQHAHSGRSAYDAYEQGVGVCRDYAHLAITLCRCLNIPARYCTGYLGDIGVPKVDLPMDFSAWFDVFVDGGWYTYDARHNEPRIGRILMAHGRDATDTALTTAFGPAQLTGFSVHTDEVDSIWNNDNDISDRELLPAYC